LLLLPESQDKMWSLKLKGLREAEIARKLNVTRQAVNKAIKGVKSKLADLFTGLSRTLDCDILKLDLEHGLFVGKIRQTGSKIYCVYVPRHGPIVLFEDLFKKGNLSSSPNILILLDFAKEYFNIGVKNINRKSIKHIVFEIFEKI